MRILFAMIMVFGIATANARRIREYEDEICESSQAGAKLLNKAYGWKSGCLVLHGSGDCNTGVYRQHFNSLPENANHFEQYLSGIIPSVHGEQNPAASELTGQGECRCSVLGRIAEIDHINSSISCDQSDVRQSSGSDIVDKLKRIYEAFESRLAFPQTAFYRAADPSLGAQIMLQYSRVTNVWNTLSTTSNKLGSLILEETDPIFVPAHYVRVILFLVLLLAIVTTIIKVHEAINEGAVISQKLQGSVNQDRRSAKALRQWVSPILFRITRRKLSSWLLITVLMPATMLVTVPVSGNKGPDLRSHILDGDEPCFHFEPQEHSFQLTCSVVDWQAEGYGAETYISLGSNETFHGRNGSVDLSGVVDFEGLFVIWENVTTFDEAPLIREVHVKNGRTAAKGGFLVRERQEFFTVDSCSSTGDISREGGGICGYSCGQNSGFIRVLNSYSTGRINGKRSGGIAGKDAGRNGGIVEIERCYSVGDIADNAAGGIIGEKAGHMSGQVYVKESFSTGDLKADGTGGIIGRAAGWNEGEVDIKECYSTGRLDDDASNSGGIVGSNTGNQCKVRIKNCYSRGDINVYKAGGIAGGDTGGWAPPTGEVYIEDAYASGQVLDILAGGIIGSVAYGFEGIIEVRYSVYNSRLAGLRGTSATEIGSSSILDDIRGQLYHYFGVKRWSDDMWAVTDANALPILEFQVQRRDIVLVTPTPEPSPTPTPTPYPVGKLDLRQNILDGLEPCFTYYSTLKMKIFQLTCSSLKWKDEGYGAKTHISLGPHEIFEGGDNIVDLSEVLSFEGLFRIREDVTSYGHAPVIKGVHVKNGRTAAKGGFLVKEQQKFFIVDLCSSTGDVFHEGGGICGYSCGQDNGTIWISNSYSTGRINGEKSGGIAGKDVGRNGGSVRIVRCHSIGDIAKHAVASGGIIGDTAGHTSGQVYVRESFSTGDIIGDGSGGIIGSAAGWNEGEVDIEECYSTGRLNDYASKSGGIVGSNTGNQCKVQIKNCYSRGNINGYKAGGIAGGDTGGKKSPWLTGKIYIENTYAAGLVFGKYAGGIIGTKEYDDFNGIIEVKYSVYDSRLVGRGDNGNDIIAIGNSDDDWDINGQLYYYNGVQRWSNDVWFVESDFDLPKLHFQGTSGEEEEEDDDSNFDDADDGSVVEIGSSMAVVFFWMLVFVIAVRHRLKQKGVQRRINSGTSASGERDEWPKRSGPERSTSYTNPLGTRGYTPAGSGWSGSPEQSSNNPGPQAYVTHINPVDSRGGTHPPAAPNPAAAQWSQWPEPSSANPVPNTYPTYINPGETPEANYRVWV